LKANISEWPDMVLLVVVKKHLSTADIDALKPPMSLISLSHGSWEVVEVMFYIFALFLPLLYHMYIL